MARSLYVYYRVPESGLARATRRLRDMQLRCMAACPGLQAELLRRPASGEAEATLMEVYRAPKAAAGVDSTMAQQIADQAAMAFADLGLAAARHLEVFEDLPPLSQ